MKFELTSHGDTDQGRVEKAPFTHSGTGSLGNGSRRSNTPAFKSCGFPCLRSQCSNPEHRKCTELKLQKLRLTIPGAHFIRGRICAEELKAGNGTVRSKSSIRCQVARFILGQRPSRKRNQTRMHAVLSRTGRVDNTHSL